MKIFLKLGLGALAVAIMMILSFTLSVKAQEKQPPADPFSMNSQKLAAMSINGGVSPTPSFMVIAGHVRVNGLPAKPGTGVEVYCDGHLAGYSETYDYSSEYLGILGYTHIYGSDFSVNPPIYGCSKDSLLKIYVNGIRAVYTPIVRWEGDPLNSPILSINTDMFIHYQWTEYGDVISASLLEESSRMRTWMNNSPYYDEVNIQETPFWQNYPEGAVKSFSLTETEGRTYLFASHSPDVCAFGPNIFVAKGADQVMVGLENNTGKPLQIILTLGDQSEPAGRLSEIGGGFEIQNSAQWGAVEVLLGDEDGPSCGKVMWDFRYLPTPHLLSVTPMNGDVRFVNVLGDNLFLKTGIIFDPSMLVVKFVRKGGWTKMYSYNYILAAGGKWEGRQVTLPLSSDFPAGEYEVSITMVGNTSNSVLYTIPKTINFLTFIPFIVR